jgi:mevalonate kinase
VTPGRVARSAAPGRICLAGESLDWMVGGPSVVAAINRRTTVSAHLVDTCSGLTIRSGPPVNVTRHVTASGLAVLAGDALDHVQAVAYQAGQLTGRDPMGELHISSDLPVAAGVSSSASVTSAVAAALLVATGIDPSPQAVARLARAGEWLTGSGAGWMDFLAVAHGGVNLVEASEPPAVRPLAGRLSTSIVLIDTLVRRATRDRLIDKRRRWTRADPDLIAYVDAATGLVDRIAAALLTAAPDPTEIGVAVTEAHGLLASRMRCSTPLIDTCVEACLTAGADGAKLTGSGHGGCLFALVAPDRVGRVLAALASLPVRTVVLDGADTDGVQVTLNERDDDVEDRDREGSTSEGWQTWAS